MKVLKLVATMGSMVVMAILGATSAHAQEHGTSNAAATRAIPVHG